MKAQAVLRSLRSGKRKRARIRQYSAIYVMPKAKEGLGSAFRALISLNSAAKLKFKTDFQTMTLFCGDKEVQPIHPGRVPVTISVQNRLVKMDDSTYKGVVYIFARRRESGLLVR